MERQHATAFDTSGGTIFGDDEPSPLQAEANERIASAVRAELQRVLASHHFETSKRCQAFLRYTVEQTLAGRGELKERVIGMEVFDRTPSYDTNQDPVVRMTAGEVRKRLALYYQSRAETSDLRLELPVGCYVPRFTVAPAAATDTDHDMDMEPFPGGPVSLIPLAPEPHTDSPSQKSGARDVAASTQRSHSRFFLAASIALLVLILGGLIFSWVTHARRVDRERAFYEFWAPFTAGSDPVLISIGQIMPTHAEVQPNIQRSSLDGPMALDGNKGYPREIAVSVLGDALAMAEVTAELKVQGKPYSIKPELNTTFANLQESPSILIGAFNNDWTINLTDPLRFHFAASPSKDSTWIEDRQHPGAVIGFISGAAPIAMLKEDYGIIVRMFDPRTGKMVMVIAGVCPFATQVGGDLVTTPSAIAEFARTAPPDWSRKNLEIVYKTNLIDGETGPAQVVSTFIW